MLLRLYSFVAILTLNYFTLQLSRLQTVTVFELGFFQDMHCILALHILGNFSWTNNSKILTFPGTLG